MTLERLSVSYDRTVTNPNDRYAPFKFGVTLEVTIEPTETAANEVPRLQAAARALVEREIKRVVYGEKEETK